MGVVLTIFTVLGCLLLLAVLLPLIKNDLWIFRIFEYPRYQKLVLCIIVSAVLVVLYPKQLFPQIVLVLLGIAIIYLLYKIFPYTAIAKKEMNTVAGSNKQNQIKIITANIYQDNTKYEKLLKLIENFSPDIIFLLETDKKWEKAFRSIEKDYPYMLKEPLDNTYGMLFYSRVAIEDGGISYLVDEEIPSVEAVVKLEGGQKVKIWGLHPKPPVPTEDSRSTAKDKELMQVALKAKVEKLPTIIMGDLNDVAWSYVTELFRKTSGLLDPRRGRGFYSTFSANHWFMRFPLDYIFCSSHFGLLQMKRLPHIGSDHFPMMIHLEYKPELYSQQDAPAADSEELQEAGEKASKPV